VTAAVLMAMAGPGCTVIGAGTGAAAATVANRFISPDAPHRISVGGTAAAGAIMGLIIDLVVLSAFQSHDFYGQPDGGSRLALPRGVPGAL
jgi:hypothetical protein